MFESSHPAAAVGKLGLALAIGSFSLATTVKLVKYGPTWKKSNVVAFIHPIAKVRERERERERDKGKTFPCVFMSSRALQKDYFLMNL